MSAAAKDHAPVAAAPLAPAPPVPTDAENPWAEAAGARAASRDPGPRVAPPTDSWDAAALQAKDPPAPSKPVRHRDLDLRLAERVRRAYRLPPAEEVLDCLDHDLLAKGRLGGRAALVLTDRHVHCVHVARRRPAEDRLRTGLDVGGVTGAGFRRALAIPTLAAGAAVGLAAAACAFVLGRTDATLPGAAPPLAATLLVLAVGALTLLVARRHEVWVDAGERRARLLVRGATPPRLQEFVDGVLAQKERRLAAARAVLAFSDGHPAPQARPLAPLAPLDTPEAEP